MSKLSEFIDGFDVQKDKEPVSFSFHCLVGEIIDDNGTNITTTTLDEKVTAPQDLIPFMP